jgi:hypothetical protein
MSIIQICGGAFVRFFATIVMRFHPPTKKVIQVLDICTVIYAIGAFICIVAMGAVTVDALSWPSLSLVGFHMAYLLLLIVASWIYSRSVLATALHNLQAPATTATPLANKNKGTLRAAPSSTNHPSSAPNNSNHHGTIASPVRTTPTSPQQHQTTPAVGSTGWRERTAGDQERIDTLRWVVRAVRGLEIVGIATG